LALAKAVRFCSPTRKILTAAKKNKKIQILSERPVFFVKSEIL
jgi:hypothetical protein